MIIVTSDNIYLGHYKNISYNNQPKTKFINKKDNNNNSNIYNYSIIESKLNNYLGSLEFEEELLFIIELINCNIPFSFTRFGDGEDSIMKGKYFGFNRDK